MSGPPGIYVEIWIHAEMERIWELTQVPALHRRWDLRFTEIEYLPRPDPAEPQRFLYETRIGPGLRIHGRGESAGTRAAEGGDRTSSLKFLSDDPKSLIVEGSGYWRYIPALDGLRFLTWYDYRVRFGAAGRVTDRVVFRPLMGWATAWSFDRMRLWAEEGQTPEASMAFALIHGTARCAIAAIWVWHGLVPKLLFRQRDELTMLRQAGLPGSAVVWVGGLEILMGVMMLLSWRRGSAFAVNAGLMVLALLATAATSPEYVTAAFNPVSLNGAMVALSVVGWIASQRVPSAGRCLRRVPGGEG